MKIVFTSDHAGFQLRQALVEKAVQDGHDVQVVGAPDEEAYDYPDAADEACGILTNGNAETAILVCGSGIGICMRANKHKGVRAADCTSVEMAMMSRKHNHANALCLGQRITDEKLAVQIMHAFLTETPDLAERHLRRVAKIDGNKNHTLQG
jgi:ribose 5-phosphate isomerase B